MSFNSLIGTGLHNISQKCENKTIQFFPQMQLREEIIRDVLGNVIPKLLNEKCIASNCHFVQTDI